MADHAEGDARRRGGRVGDDRATAILITIIVITTTIVSLSLRLASIILNSFQRWEVAEQLSLRR